VIKGFAGFVVVAACLVSACGSVATKLPGGSGGSSDARTSGSGGSPGAGGEAGNGAVGGDSGSDSGTGGDDAGDQTGSGGSGGAPAILVRAGIVPVPSGSTLAGSGVVVIRQGLSVPASTLCNSSICVVNGGIGP